MVFGWGCGTYGQLGIGYVEKVVGPMRIAGVDGRKVRRVVAGGNQSGVEDDSGKGYMWGRGVGVAVGGKGDVCFPKEVKVDCPIAELKCGRDFSLVLCTDGLLYAFGSNHYGQLDLPPSPPSSPLFRKLESLSFSSIVSIACGTHHALALSCKYLSLFLLVVV
jgi:alpha-tubulin suppressor-like RCC1 family protein